ncbi:MAG TPA: hypothetical protein VI731_07640, partial [Bacteroidia bacterium]|nr:hypothetical protein [Bacteroidia bacterium]
VSRSDKDRGWIDHIDSRMQVDKTAMVPEPALEKMEDYFYFCRMVDEKLFVFYVARNSKENKYTLYGQEINKSALEVTGQLQELMTVSYVIHDGFYRPPYWDSYFTSHYMKYKSGLGPYWQTLSDSPFSSYPSPDGSKLLVLSRVVEPGSNKKESKEIVYRLTVFTTDLQKTLDREIRVKCSPALFSLEQLTLDDKGNILMIGKEFQELSVAKQSWRDGKIHYKYHLYRFAIDDENDIVIDLKGKFIRDIRAGLAPNGDVIVCGFFSDSPSYIYSMRGAFYMSLDPKTNDVKVQNSSEFDTNFITQYLTEKEKKREKKKERKGFEPGIANLRMDELLVKTDGGAVIISEQYYYIRNTGSKTSSTYYIFNDILVMHFLPDGSLSWKCKIPKRQLSASDNGYYSSYAYAAVGDKLYFIYNDNPKHLLIKPGENFYPFVGWSGPLDYAVVLVEVDENGKTTRELLKASIIGDVLIRPSKSEQTGSNEMLICGQRKKAYQFSKVTFK